MLKSAQDVTTTGAAARLVPINWSNNMKVRHLFTVASGWKRFNWLSQS